MMRQIVIGTGLLLAAATTAGAQHHHHGASTDAAPGSPRVTMEELHRAGGVPRGWKFTLPAGGDSSKGRQLFAELECYKCHVINGANFPPSGGDGKTGPELTGMGAHHPAEYFAESILSPNAVLLDGPGWIGPDGTSIMPSYADALSVRQLVDLVAFIKSQDDGGGHAHHHEGAMQERIVGPYRVRLEFKTAGGHDHGGGAHAHHAPAAAGAAGHLMVFVADATTGDPVPYLPVSAGVQVAGAAARIVKLTPMTGDGGFHYGANATLPPRTTRIVLTIGATTMQVMGADRARYAKPQMVAFDWSAPPQ